MYPNILITGTPGCGKTTTCNMLLKSLEDIELNQKFKLIQVGDMVKEKGYYTGFDEKFQSYYIDEDAVLDEMEPMIAESGCIVDHHSCDFFPERFFDLIIVLTCDTKILYDRLLARKYPLIKVQENVECEIMQVVQQDALEGYEREKVVILSSNDIDEMAMNVQRIETWITKAAGNHS